MKDISIAQKLKCLTEFHSHLISLGLRHVAFPREVKTQFLQNIPLLRMVLNRSYIREIFMYGIAVHHIRKFV
jgi:hypothetical protein